MLLLCPSENQPSEKKHSEYKFYDANSSWPFSAVVFVLFQKDADEIESDDTQEENNVRAAVDGCVGYAEEQSYEPPDYAYY